MNCACKVDHVSAGTPLRSGVADTGSDGESAVDAAVRIELLGSCGTRGSRGNRGSRGTRGLMTGAKVRGVVVYSNVLSWHSGEQHRMVLCLVATA